MDPVERYLEVFESLRRKKRWATDTNVLRFAALTLAAADNAAAADLEDTASVMAKEAGGFSPLASSLRHAVAAIVTRRGLDPVGVVRQVKATLAEFKKHKLRKGGAHPWLAALLLVIHHDGGEVAPTEIARMKEIVDRWAVDHRWLTGVDDYPMAAMHATRDVSVEQLALEVEEIYLALRQAKMSAGNALQLVSHLLVFGGQGPRAAASRFEHMAAAFKDRGQRIGQGQYDEVALLVLGGGQADEIATRVVAYRDRLRAVKPKPQKEFAFSIATGVVLAEQAATTGAIEDAEAAANLRSVQALIEAQQAAMIACIAATSAATAASSG